MYWDGINPLKMFTKDFDMFWKFYPAAMSRMIVLKSTGKKLRLPYYGTHLVLSQNKGNEMLKQALLTDKPFMFGRHGSNELLIASAALVNEKGITERVDAKKYILACEHSGFFPCEDELFHRFNQLIIEASEQCDLYGTFRMLMEDYYIKNYMKKDVVLTHLNMMDFWRYDEPFTYALRGQKVLVVHYLAEQIKEQYKKRELLFKNPKVLPEFELMAMPAVQTIAGNRDPRFETWFDALDYMYEETKKYDYDVAILGCGAYGMPLAAKLKKDGKKVIVMGGVLQMLFGIKGKRWDDEPKAAALYNENWVVPDPTLKPKRAETVEGGCYW